MMSSSLLLILGIGRKRALWGNTTEQIDTWAFEEEGRA